MTLKKKNGVWDERESREDEIGRPNTGQREGTPQIIEAHWYEKAMRLCSRLSNGTEKTQREGRGINGNSSLDNLLVSKPEQLPAHINPW